MASPFCFWPMAFAAVEMILRWMLWLSISGELRFKVTICLIRFAAFILYRQHYQSIVVAHNPGMANPEISKVIGEQWRQLSEEEKSKWKALAEVSTLLASLIVRTHRANSITGRENPPCPAVSCIPLPTTTSRPGWLLSQLCLGNQSQSLWWLNLQSMRRPHHECPLIPHDSIHADDQPGSSRESLRSILASAHGHHHHRDDRQQLTVPRQGRQSTQTYPH